METGIVTRLMHDDNERDIVADSKHNIYHKIGCKLISKIHYKHKTRISRLNNP